MIYIHIPRDGPLFAFSLFTPTIINEVGSLHTIFRPRTDGALAARLVPRLVSFASSL